MIVGAILTDLGGEGKCCGVSDKVGYPSSSFFFFLAVIGLARSVGEGLC